MKYTPKINIYFKEIIVWLFFFSLSPSLIPTPYLLPRRRFSEFSSRFSVTISPDIIPTG